ncbi:zinc-ribbon domain-containing protein [Corallococcus exercitus]|uniref:zinc-ribbon domain-containing protein n=1 Tax=Corallococcus exercitus TaxID=2316736 RepID=UPI0011C386EA|nr:zinc-ribbon domain-containing protein [Corallococcus exercitus]
MQIACPQCSMQYVLDARLLPPGGASVQCTRCGHVFMASPTGVMAPAPKIPPAGGGDRAGAPSSTQIFGGESGVNLKSTNLFAGSTTASGSFVPQPTPPSGALASSGVIPPPPSIAPVAAPSRPPVAPAASGTQPPAMGTTRAFGAVGSGVGAPPVASTAQEAGQGAAPGGTTRAFGAVSASSSGSFRLSEPGASAAGNSTRAFGAVSGPPAPGAADVSGGSTRAFGAVSGSTAAPDGGVEPGGSTKAFGAVSGPSEPAAPSSRSFENISPSADSGTPPWSAASGSRPKLVPDGHGDAPWATGAPTATVSLPDDDAPFARTEPSKAAAPSPNASLLGSGLDRPLPSRKPSSDLPPELLGASRTGSVVIEDGDSRSSTLSRVLLVLAVLAGITLAGYLAYPAFRDRNSAMPEEAVDKKDAAVKSLRRDDAASREQAIQDLQGLATAHPKYAEVQAELAVAYTLQLSDLHAEFDQLRIQTDLLKRQLDEVTSARSSPGWMGQANALRAEMSEAERAMKPLRTDITERRKVLEALVETLRAAPDVEPAATVAARLKAQSLHAAVTGASNALGLAERLRQAELTPSWSIVARAEFALSSGSPAATLKAVSEELAALRTQDRTFLRPYFLGARLALRQNDPDTARNLLNELLALNPKHELAKRMLAQLPAAGDAP